MLSKPAEYKVNWVRVYQDKNDPKQKVGCSTKERPTRKFIEAHKKKYMQAGDVSAAVCFCAYHVHNLLLLYVTHHLLTIPYLYIRRLNHLNQSKTAEVHARSPHHPTISNLNHAVADLEAHVYPKRKHVNVSILPGQDHTA